MKKILLIIFAMFLAFNPVFAKKNSEEVEQTINWQPYVDKLDKQIRKNWDPPANCTKDIAKAKFKWHKDGSITDIEIQGTESYLFAKRIVDALILSSQKVPLPKNFEKDFVTTGYTFNPQDIYIYPQIPNEGVWGHSSSLKRKH